MKKLKIAVLFGGASKDYAVSLRSAAGLIPELEKKGFDVFPLGITRQGRWLFCPPNLVSSFENKLEKDLAKWETDEDCFSAILSPDPNHSGLLGILPESDGGNKLSFIRINGIISVIHGNYGNAGYVQGLIKLSGIPYLGNSMRTAAVTNDASILYPVLESMDVNLYPSCFVSKRLFLSSEKNRKLILDSAEKELNPNKSGNSHKSYPFFVRACSQSPSIGECVANDRAELETALKIAFAHHNEAIIEKLSNAYLERKTREFEALVYPDGEILVGEIVSTNNFQSFVKFEPEEFHADRRIYVFIERNSDKIFVLLECTSPVLIRYIYDKGKIFFRSISVNPGLSRQSALPALSSDFSKFIAEVKQFYE